ncbi:VanZ family protein [Allosaccharopolyspora coralli]|uniref:VanZ family protein n=1 Tax=Allosaccharopolyspora coralli TaxID=2665642 RepID=UPI001E405FF9|nr:VanZ family protein [Allosaccharopolyspora coralli]
MHQLLVSFNGLVPIALVLFPVAILVAVVSVALRSRLRDVPFIVRDPLIDALLVYSSLVTAYLVLSPQAAVVEPLALNPGNDIAIALAAHPGDARPWIQLLGNMLLLVPLGALAPFRLTWLDKPLKIALAGLVVSCVVESVQFLTVTGRVASTDDIALNTLGALAGGLLTRGPWWQRDPGVPGRSAHSGAGEGRYPVWWLIAEVEEERRRQQHRVPTGRHGAPTRSGSAAVRGRGLTGAARYP